MQEEVENRTVNLVISTSRLTARALISGYRKFAEAHKNHSAKKAAKNRKRPSGKQTVKQLIGQNQGVTSIDLAKTDLKGFEKYARTFGVDYAITKDKSGNVPKYLCFFKARDTDAMTAAFNEYSQKVMRKEERPSILQQLKDIKALVAALPGKVKVRDKQREQMR